VNWHNNPLKRPFPDREFSRSTVIGMGRVAIFVFMALYLLRPFGMRIEGDRFLTCLGYGLVTFLVGTGYAYVTTRVLGWKKSGANWTLGKWILDAGILLACIAVGNFLFYNMTVDWRAMDLLALVYITIPTVIIGLFPIAFSGMAVQMRAERENQKVAGEMQIATLRKYTQATARLIDMGEGQLLLDPESILFCEARGNYLRCVYLAEGSGAEQTIRATLSSVAEKLEGTPIVRCHRSFLVNSHLIAQASGNAQGLRLKMQAWPEEEVPVSRAYVKPLREKIG
jgi:hypothetical protein